MANVGITPVTMARPALPGSAAPLQPSSNDGAALPVVPPGVSGQTIIANTPRVMALVRNWSGQLTPRIASALQRPAEPVAAPLTRLLPALFSPATRVLTVSGVAPLSDRAPDSAPFVQGVRAALTERRLQALESLRDDGQRALAGSLVAASLSAFEAGVLNADEFGQAIDLSIREAQAYRGSTPPAQWPSTPQGTPDAPIEDVSVQPPPRDTPDLPLPAVPEAQPAPQTPRARLESLRRDFVSFQRALQADSLEGEGGARQLLTRLRRDSESLRQDAPGELAGQAREIEQAADLLFRIETSARREIRGEASSGALTSARAERGTSSGTSVTEQRLGAVRDLMALYRVPTNFRAPAWQARLLEDAFTFYNANRQRLRDGFPIETTDMQDGSISPARQMQIFASPQNYLEYLKSSPAGWQQVAEQRLNKAIVFDRLQRDANNGGVLLPAQMREIEREPDGWRRLYLFREAAQGIERLKHEYSDWVLGRPTGLQPDRPRYTGLVEYYLGGSSGEGIFPGGLDSPATSGLGRLLGSNEVAPRMPRDVRLQARTLDFIGTIERELALTRDPAATTRALATIDGRIVTLRQQSRAPTTSAQDRVYIDQALRALGNFRNVVGR